MSHCNRSVAMENQHALRESVPNLNQVTNEVAQLDFSAKWLLEDGLPRLMFLLQQNVSILLFIYLSLGNDKYIMMQYTNWINSTSPQQ